MNTVSYTGSGNEAVNKLKLLFSALVALTILIYYELNVQQLFMEDP